MNQPTKSQIEFSRTMTDRQWAVLGSLLIPYFLSATERGDPELWALVRNNLAYSYLGAAGSQAIWMWHATEIGKTLVAEHFHTAHSEGPSRTLPGCGR